MQYFSVLTNVFLCQDLDLSKKPDQLERPPPRFRRRYEVKEVLQKADFRVGLKKSDIVFVELSIDASEMRPFLLQTHASSVMSHFIWVGKLQNGKLQKSEED